MHGVHQGLLVWLDAPSLSNMEHKLKDVNIFFVSPSLSPFLFHPSFSVLSLSHFLFLYFLFSLCVLLILLSSFSYNLHPFSFLISVYGLTIYYSLYLWLTHIKWGETQEKHREMHKNMIVKLLIWPCPWW